MNQALVIGMGKSGKAAYRFLKAKGWDPVGYDASWKVVETLRQEGLDVLKAVSPASFDLIVLSPGVPQVDPLVQKALEMGKEVIGEAELAFRYAKQPCIAITGTNGKTTVTLLVTHILKEAGKKAAALGNVGEPLTNYFVNPDPEEIVVAELSSYQLETMQARVYDVGVILNVTPDHLDRYDSMDAYAAAKCRLQNCMKAGAPFYVNVEMLGEFGRLLKTDYRTFGAGAGAWLWTDKEIFKEVEKVELILPIRYRQLGMHESENALAAWAICREFNVSKEMFLSALETFQKPAHRIEFVATIEDVHYFDDSKGTNLDATAQAVSSMRGPVILIAGGVDKGAPYTPWQKMFLGKVREVAAIGEAAPKIAYDLAGSIPVAIHPTLDAAVAYAAEIAKPGDSILLSPGCSSFDMFRDYAHRGEEFKRCVHQIRERRKKE